MSAPIDHPLNDPNSVKERISRRFEDRPQDEQRDFLSMTWCQSCYQADLGMTDPIEYEWHGRVFVEGRCVQCGERVATEIVEED